MLGWCDEGLSEVPRDDGRKEDEMRWTEGMKEDKWRGERGGDDG